MENRDGRWPQHILPWLAGIAALAAAPSALAVELPEAEASRPAVARTFAPTLIAATELVEGEAVRVFVRDIRLLVRVEAFAEEQLKPLVAHLVGRELAVDEIRRALAEIADNCAAKGHPVRALLPQQSFLDGVVRVVVAEAPPQAVRPHEQHLVAEAIAARYRVTRREVEPVVATAYRAGRESAIDPLLILAVIAVESSFNPAAVSTVGARGLMQVMPQFHREKIARHGDEDVLFDPKTNVLVGATILREYLQRFGETVAALQMYVGAFNDPSFAYARRVLAERSLFERLVARARRST